MNPDQNIELHYVWCVILKKKIDFLLVILSWARIQISSCIMCDFLKKQPRFFIGDSVMSPDPNIELHYEWS